MWESDVFGIAAVQRYTRLAVCGADFSTDVRNAASWERESVKTVRPASIQ
jgi:hypothetical protein